MKYLWPLFFMGVLARLLMILAHNGVIDYSVSYVGLGILLALYSLYVWRTWKQSRSTVKDDEKL